MPKGLGLYTSVCGSKLKNGYKKRNMNANIRTESSLEKDFVLIILG